MFINPVITTFSQQTVGMYEGCGNVIEGNLFGEVERLERVALTYQDANGAERADELDGLLARVIQHEIDHLDGILFTERVADPKTFMNREHYLATKK